MVERLAEEVRLLPWGKAVFTPSLPAVRAFNYVRIADRELSVPVDQLIDETHELQGSAGLGHRRVSIDDPELGASIAPEFSARGWKVDRFLVMTYDGAIPTGAPAHTVRKLTADEYRSVHAQVIAEESPNLKPEVAEQLLEMDAVFAGVVNTTYLATMGEPAITSVCQIYSDGQTAQIEDVATLKEHRRLGYARSLMHEAVQSVFAEGNEFLFLVADADDWPKDFYEAIGFRPAGVYYEFVVPGDTGYGWD